MEPLSHCTTKFEQRNRSTPTDIVYGTSTQNVPLLIRLVLGVMVVLAGVIGAGRFASPVGEDAKAPAVCAAVAAASDGC